MVAHQEWWARLAELLIGVLNSTVQNWSDRRSTVHFRCSDLYRSKILTTRRTVQNHSSNCTELFGVLRSNGTAPRTEQIELFGDSNCTVTVRAVQKLQKNKLWILRSNDCTEHSDRVAVPYWTLRIQILSTPIELYRTSDRSLTVHCTARPNCTEHFDQNYSNSSEHFDRNIKHSDRTVQNIRSNSQCTVQLDRTVQNTSIRTIRTAQNHSVELYR